VTSVDNDYKYLQLALSREVALRFVQPQAEPTEQRFDVPPGLQRVRLRRRDFLVCGRRGPEEMV
jgi:hypothetical protein